MTDDKSDYSEQMSYHFFYLAFPQRCLERGGREGFREQVVVRDEREEEIPEGKQRGRGDFSPAGICCSS